MSKRIFKFPETKAPIKNVEEKQDAEHKELNTSTIESAEPKVESKPAEKSVT